MKKFTWQEHMGKIKCPRCNCKYTKPEFGFYECVNCGLHENIEQALVRTYYYESRESTMKEELTECISLSGEEIELVCKKIDESLEKLELEKHTCAKCGKIIMYGRYCESCKKELLGDIRLGNIR